MISYANIFRITTGAIFVGALLVAFPVSAADVSCACGGTASPALAGQTPAIVAVAESACKAAGGKWSVDAGGIGDCAGFTIKVSAPDCGKIDDATVIKSLGIPAEVSGSTALVKKCAVATAASTGAGGASSGGTVKLQNPLGEGATIPQVLGRIISAGLGIIGSITLLMFVYGGFLWLTSAGSADKIKHGKDVMVWSTIGLIIVFASYALVRFIFKGIGAISQ